jgi:hypothetical protein
MSAAMATTSSGSTDSMNASEWTRQNMLNDLTQQKGFLIGAGIAVGLTLFMLSRRRPAHEQAARRLVRDWRNIDDAEDARDLLGENIPKILRPVLLSALEEIQEQVHQLFGRMEREIRRL